MIDLLKKVIVDLPIRMKWNSKRISGNSLSSLGSPEQGYQRCFADVTNRFHYMGRILPYLSLCFRVGISLRSRRLEVVGTRKNGRARRRHACLPRERPFSLSPATSKRLPRGLGGNDHRENNFETFGQTCMILLTTNGLKCFLRS